MEKYRTIGYEESESLSALANALASPLRLCMMRELSGNSMSVKELAFRLNIPMSTASANVKMLEEAGLIERTAGRKRILTDMGYEVANSL